MPILERNFELVVVFFIYGLSFFTMGLAMMLEARRSPLLAEARILAPIAVFGFVHGAHEWFEMLLIVRGWFDLPVMAFVPWMRLGFLVVSFSALVLFGLQVLRPQQKNLSTQEIWLGIGLFLVYSLLVVWVSYAHRSAPQNFIEITDGLARYTLAVPGAMLAALAFNRQARDAVTQGRHELGYSLRLAAASFALYSLSQLFVPPADLFPAQYINSAVFMEWTGIPIQAVRALLAVMITVGLIRAGQVVEDERQRRFQQAQQARLEALELIQLEFEQREVMRRELLRHTVIAQEDERARIARELHDETAQFLTALRLNLATLHNPALARHKFTEILGRLETLSQQMSQGIYRMVHDLRPAHLDDLGLVAALQYLADDERFRNGMVVKLQVDGARQRLDVLAETVLFRVAQESLTNAARYANCKQVTVRLWFEEEQVSLQVQDDGVGFVPDKQPAAPQGWGIAGMRERVESVGGVFLIRSAPGEGTLVSAVIPLTRFHDGKFKQKARDYDPVDAGR